MTKTNSSDSAGVADKPERTERATDQVPLGSMIRDRITGMRGIAYARVELVNGTVQYTMQQRAKADATSMPEGWNFDWQQLEILIDEPNVCDAATVPESLPDIKLGATYKDMVSGAIGIAISTCLFLNGCFYVTIERPLREDVKEKEDRRLFVPWQRLLYVDEGLNVKHKVKSASKATATPTPEVKKPKPGGPMTRAQRP